MVNLISIALRNSIFRYFNSFVQEKIAEKYTQDLMEFCGTLSLIIENVVKFMVMTLLNMLLPQFVVVLKCTQYNNVDRQKNIHNKSIQTKIYLYINKNIIRNITKVQNIVCQIFVFVCVCVSGYYLGICK